MQENISSYIVELNGEEVLDVKQMLRAKNPIFQNESILSKEYKPDKIIARNEQIGELVGYLEPIIRHSSPTNVFIWGGSGVGKTITVEHVVKEINETLEEDDPDNVVDFIKINCSVDNNDSDICSTILSHFSINIPSRGRSVSSSMRLIWKAINEEAQNHVHYTLILFFDEIDKWNLTKQRSLNSDKAQLDMLYTFTRAFENNLITTNNCKIGIITASNRQDFLTTVENRINSSAGFCYMNFPCYNENDLCQILMNRNHAFQPNVITPELIHNVATRVADRYSGDARRALDILMIAGKITKDEGCNHITKEHLEKADEKISLIASGNMIANFSKHDKLLIISSYLCEQNLVYPNTGLLQHVYENICKILDLKPSNKATISRKITLLSENGVIETKRGLFKGNTRIIALSDTVVNSIEYIYTKEFKFEIENEKFLIESIIEKGSKKLKRK